MNEKLKVKSEKYKFRKFEAITLISLVITIVVLIILANVAIYLSVGNNGIFVRSKEARETTNKQAATEKINLKITTAQMNSYVEKQVMPTLKELSEVLKDDNEIAYVTETSKKQASAEYNVPSNTPSKIYTKLNEYPYEFEINEQLQLASIDGVKIANNEQIKSDSWKKYMMNENGYVIGTEEILLPTSFEELIIKVNGNYAYQYHVIYDALTDKGEYMLEGNYNGRLYWTNTIISKSSFKLINYFIDGNDYKNSAKIEIWYK